MVYTVTETGLTPAEAGVIITTTNTVAANLGALDTKIGAFTASPEYADAFTAATPNAIETTDTVATGLSKLDNKVKALVDEVLDNEETTANAISAVVTAAGVKKEDGEIAYVANEDANYISEATSLKDADDKLDAAIKALADAAVKSTDKTIKITSTNGTDLSVNIDGTSIKKDGDGVLSSIVEGKDAISVSDATATANQIISLLLDTTKAASTGCAKIDLTQSENGLFAEVKLDNTAAATPAEGEKAEGGIGLAQGTDGTVKATLYWGEF